MVRRRRRPAATHNNLPARTSLTTQLSRMATAPAAKAAYVTIGTLGLAALGIAIFGPRRFQREIMAPAARAVGDRTDRIWADSKDLRDQLTGLINRAGNEAGRDRLVRSFQSWIGHFRAS